MVAGVLINSTAQVELKSVGPWKQVENLANHQLKLQEQIITLEGSKATAETFSALKSGAGAMKQLQKARGQGTGGALRVTPVQSTTVSSALHLLSSLCRCVPYSMTTPGVSSSNVCSS